MNQVKIYVIIVALTGILCVDARKRYGKGKRYTENENMPLTKFGKGFEERKLDKSSQISIAKWSMNELQNFIQLDGNYKLLNVTNFQATVLHGVFYKFSASIMTKSEV
jgi:hypothetical protein